MRRALRIICRRPLQDTRDGLLEYVLRGSTDDASWFSGRPCRARKRHTSNSTARCRLTKSRSMPAPKTALGDAPALPSESSGTAAGTSRVTSRVARIARNLARPSQPRLPTHPGLMNYLAEKCGDVTWPCLLDDGVSKSHLIRDHQAGHSRRCRRDAIRPLHQPRPQLVPAHFARGAVISTTTCGRRLRPAGRPSVVPPRRASKRPPVNAAPPPPLPPDSPGYYMYRTTAAYSGWSLPTVSSWSSGPARAARPRFGTRSESCPETHHRPSACGIVSGTSGAAVAAAAVATTNSPRQRTGHSSSSGLYLEQHWTQARGVEYGGCRFTLQSTQSFPRRTGWHGVAASRRAATCGSRRRSSAVKRQRDSRSNRRKRYLRLYYPWTSSRCTTATRAAAAA